MKMYKFSNEKKSDIIIHAMNQEVAREIYDAHYKIAPKSCVYMGEI